MARGVGNAPLHFEATQKQIADNAALRMCSGTVGRVAHLGVRVEKELEASINAVKARLVATWRMNAVRAGMHQIHWLQQRAVSEPVERCLMAHGVGIATLHFALAQRQVAVNAAWRMCPGTGGT